MTKQLKERLLSVQQIPGWVVWLYWIGKQKIGATMQIEEFVLESQTGGLTDCNIVQTPCPTASGAS